MRASRLLSPALFALAVALTVAASAYYYGAFAEKAGPGYTEFYLVAADGGAPKGSADLRAGQSFTTGLAIDNHEGVTLEYEIDVVFAGRTVQRSSINLGDGRSIATTVEVPVSRPGQQQPLMFELYRQGQDAPYRSLQVYLNVAP
jgi:uncharacterized membrane protein